MRTNLLIVGAGPAGLAHAFWRKRTDDGLDFRIVDQDPEPGGWMRTRRIDGYLCESGPQGIRPTEVSDEFFDALGIANAVIVADPAAELRSIARDGKLHAMPSGPRDLLSTKLLTLGGKLRLLSEPFRRRGTDDTESLAAFVRRRLGEQAVPMAESMASGVFGGDAHELEMAAAFPAVTALEREHGSLLRGMKARRRAAGPERPTLCTFRGGMETLALKLRDHVGSRLMLGREVRNVTRCEDGWSVTIGGEVSTEVFAKELVLAIPSRRAADLLADVDAELATELSAIPFASLANIYLGFREADANNALRGFGFLLDRREGSAMLGAIYCSSIFQQSAAKGRFLVRVLAGGALHSKTMDRDEEDLASEAEGMLRRYTGLSGSLLFKRVYKAHDAIPQFVRGHTARSRRIRELASKHEGLRLIGNSYDDVSVVGQLRRP